VYITAATTNTGTTTVTATTTTATDTIATIATTTTATTEDKNIMMKLSWDFEIKQSTICRYKLFKRHNRYLLETILRNKIKLSVYVKRDFEPTKGTTVATASAYYILHMLTTATIASNTTNNTTITAKGIKEKFSRNAEEDAELN
jgi:hypothetical protein